MLTAIAPEMEDSQIGLRKCWWLPTTYIPVRRPRSSQNTEILLLVSSRIVGNHIACSLGGCLKLTMYLLVLAVRLRSAPDTWVRLYNL